MAKNKKNKIKKRLKIMIPVSTSIINPKQKSLKTDDSHPRKGFSLKKR
jgi:hypothetical protein